MIGDLSATDCTWKFAHQKNYSIFT